MTRMPAIQIKQVSYKQVLSSLLLCPTNIDTPIAADIERLNYTKLWKKHATVDIRLRPPVLSVVCHFKHIPYSRLPYVLQLCVQTRWHPQNRKYIPSNTARGGSRHTTTCVENLVKFGHLVFEICSQTYSHTQTDTMTKPTTTLRIPTDGERTNMSISGTEKNTKIKT